MQDRKRLDKDIIEAGRSNGRGSHKKFEGRINRGNLQHIHEDALVERERMFMDYGRDGRSYQDRLGPLYKYLLAHAGQPWDKVYSKLCRAYDARSISGWHLIRAHVDNEVYTWAEWCERKYRWYFARSGEFYVNQHGILTYAGDSAPTLNRRILRNRRPQLDENGYVDLEVDGEKRRFRYLNGCWFAVEYEVVNVPVEEWDGSSMKWDGNHYVFTRKITRIVKKDKYISQRQLNKKELLKFGLKNDPTFSDH